MPRILFFTGTAFCLFLALTSAGQVARELQGGGASILSLGGTRAGWAVLIGLVAGLAVASIFLRMAALLAPRNLFGAFVGVFSVTAALASLSGLLFLEARMAAVARHAADIAALRSLAETHFTFWLLLGYFVSVSLLSLRPYFRVQASRILSMLVFLPLPLFFLVMLQELFVTSSTAPVPASTPASMAFFSTLSILFFAIAVHCVRHRHLFLEMTNLRELLDSRVDLAGHGTRPVRIAFDSQ